jgi:hypothetical protein
MNPETIAAINRQEREIVVAGDDMKEARERIEAFKGKVQASNITNRNGIWKLEIYWQKPNSTNP